MIKFLPESCLSGLVRLGRIRNRFEKTIGDLTLWIKPPVKASISISRPGRFFHYETLSTSSLSKNLIIPEAVMLLKMGRKDK